MRLAEQIKSTRQHCQKGHNFCRCEPVVAAPVLFDDPGRQQLFEVMVELPRRDAAERGLELLAGTRASQQLADEEYAWWATERSQHTGQRRGFQSQQPRQRALYLPDIVACPDVDSSGVCHGTAYVALLVGRPTTMIELPQ